MLTIFLQYFKFSVNFISISSGIDIYNTIPRIGDYPGLAEASGTMESGKHSCRWCNSTFTKCWAINRVLFANFRQFLPLGDPMRLAGVYGRAEIRDPPTPRTHEEMVADAIESENSPLKPDNAAHPRYQSGVFKMCPLALLPLWNMVWDFLPDWMHMTKGYFHGHMLPLMKALRAPGAATTIKNPTLAKTIEQYYSPPFPIHLLLVAVLLTSFNFPSPLSNLC